MLTQHPSIFISLLSAQTIFTSLVSAEPRAALLTEVGPLSPASASSLNLRPVPNFVPDLTPTELYPRATDPGIIDRYNQYLYLCTSPGCTNCYSIQIHNLTQSHCYTANITYLSAKIIKAGNNVFDYSILLGTNETSCARGVTIPNPNTCINIMGTTIEPEATCEGAWVTSPTTPAKGCYW